MNNYLIDSSAWIDYFLANDKGEKVKRLIEQQDNQYFTSSLSVAEITIKLKKLDIDPKSSFEMIKTLSIILFVDDEIAFEAGLLYVEKRKKLKDIGIVDVMIMSQARKNNLTIVTGDKEHFKDEKNVILI